MSLHPLTGFLLVLFTWPTGIVVGNLIASLMWVPVQWVGVHMRLRAHLDELKEMLDPCPHCGNRRSGADLLPSMTAPSIVSVSKTPEA